MNHDTAYIVPDDPAWTLQIAGRWDDALRALPAGAHAARARILTDRFWWRLDDPAEAEDAVTTLGRRDPVLAGFHAAQVSYTRLLFDAAPRPGDADRARTGFAAAAEDERVAGWGMFWLGVLADHVDHAPDRAVAAYRGALARSHDDGDRLLESYAERHLGGHALERGEPSGVDRLRWSYHLRAALGARPQTAAAAATLASALPPGAEADQLTRTADLVARDLSLTWMLKSR